MATADALSIAAAILAEGSPDARERLLDDLRGRPGGPGGSAIGTSWRWGRLLHGPWASHPGRATTHAPQLVPSYVALLGLCLLAGAGRNVAAALGVWAVSLVACLLAAALLGAPAPRAVPLHVVARALTVVSELAYLGETVRARDPRPLWSPVAPGSRLQGPQARDWTARAVVLALTLLVLAAVAR